MPMNPSGAAINPIIPKKPKYLSLLFHCLNSEKRTNKQNMNRNQELCYWNTANAWNSMKPKKPGQPSKNFLSLDFS